MKPRARRRLGVALALVGLVLFLAVAAPWLGFFGAPAADGRTVAAAPPVDDPAVDLAALSLPGLAAYPQTRERPLFVSTRRVIGVAPAADATGVIGGRYVFTGVVISPGKRFVLLRPVDGGAVRRIGEGETLDGWLIEEIANDFLTVVADGRREVVPLLGSPNQTRQ